MCLRDPLKCQNMQATEEGEEDEIDEGLSSMEARVVHEFEIRVFNRTAPRVRRVVYANTGMGWDEFLDQVRNALELDPEALLRVADDTLVLKRAGYDPKLLAAGGAYEVTVLSTDSSDDSDDEDALDGARNAGAADNEASVRGRLSSAVSLDRTLPCRRPSVAA